MKNNKTTNWAIYIPYIPYIVFLKARDRTASFSLQQVSSLAEFSLSFSLSLSLPCSLDLSRISLKFAGMPNKCRIKLSQPSTYGTRFRGGWVWKEYWSRALEIAMKMCENVLSHKFLLQILHIFINMTILSIREMKSR